MRCSHLNRALGQEEHPLSKTLWAIQPNPNRWVERMAEEGAPQVIVIRTTLIIRAVEVEKFVG